jgi:hypothetical protein
MGKVCVFGTFVLVAKQVRRCGTKCGPSWHHTDSTPNAPSQQHRSCASKCLWSPHAQRLSRKRVSSNAVVGNVPCGLGLAGLLSLHSE